MDLTNVRVTGQIEGRWPVATDDTFRVTINPGEPHETVINEPIGRYGMITCVQIVRGEMADGRGYLGTLLIFEKD